MDSSSALALASPPSSPAALAPEVQPPPHTVEQISADFAPRLAADVRPLTREELLVPGEKSYMTKGVDGDPVTGKKRTADVPLEEDSSVEAAVDQNEILEEGQDVNTEKLRGRNLTLRCEPKTICVVVSLLNVPQKEKVKELGFGSLLDFNMDSLWSWDLIVWLMDHLDPNKMVLDFGSNQKLEITEHTVHCVLGLKRGHLDPPLNTDTPKLQSLRDTLGVEGRNINVVDLVEKIKCGGTDKFTMQCVMMIVLAKLLACNTNFFISSSVWSMVQDIDNFHSMNWCKFTIDHLRYSATTWKRLGGRIKKPVYGCCAFLVMYYLDNLNCKHMMSRVEIPRAKFFAKEVTAKLGNADMLTDQDGFPTFGNLNLRTLSGTCYDDRTGSSRNVPVPVMSDIADVCASPHNQIGASASHCKNLSSRKKKKAKWSQHLNNHVILIEDDPPEEIRLEDDTAVIGDGGSVVTPQETNPVLESIADAHEKPPTVPDASEEDGMAERDEQRGDHAVTEDFEDGDSPVPGKSATTQAVQLASTFCNEQMKEFMTGTSEPEVLESRLSKLVSLLAQVRAQVASETRNSELEQKVKELTEKLCNTEEELGAAQAKLRGAEAATLESQSAVAAVKGLSLRLSAAFVRLGDTRPFPPPVADNDASLLDAVKILEDRVSLVEAVSRGHATTLARNSVAFGAAALLCRSNRGAEALRDAVAVDTRRFLRSQGPDFGSLMGQVVDAVEQQHASVPQIQGGRATGVGGQAANRKE